MEYCHNGTGGSCGHPGPIAGGTATDGHAGVYRVVRLHGAGVSMEPVYHTGSLIYVRDVDPMEIQPGQVITFMLDEDTVATHRVVEVVPDEIDRSVVRFRTKGDANDAEDGGLVHCNNVLGTPVFTIPQLGYLANYIQKPPGMYLAISAGALLLMLVFLPDLFGSDEPEEKKKRRKDKGKRAEQPQQEE